MKAFDIIKGFCTNWNNCENCDWVWVPDHGDYDEWAMDYYGFIPAGLKPGATYLVVWGQEGFYDGNVLVLPDCYYMDEDREVRFYEIEE